MMKYSLVLYHKEYGEFLSKLQELGLVDVTVSNLESDDTQRRLLARIDNYQDTIDHLRRLEKEGTKPTTDFVDSRHAMESYHKATERIDAHLSELAKVKKDISELEPWGLCDIDKIAKIVDGGVELRFYSLFIKEFESGLTEWSEEYLVQEISRDSLSVYFIVASPVDKPVTIDAQELFLPGDDLAYNLALKERIESEIEEEKGVVASAIPFISQFRKERKALEQELYLENVSRSGEREAEGTIILLEGWATCDTQDRVDAMLDSTGTFYIKENPTKEDEAPVLLKNNRFFSLFENIGNFYALPRYGTMDTTPYWGPFYALFFGFCLGDAGYGAIYVILGMAIGLNKKMQPAMRGIGWLVACCGMGAVLFGLLTGNIFGIQLAELKVFDGIKQYFVSTDKLFTLALAIGVVHILYAMTIKVVNISRVDGFRYAMAPLGWLIVLLSSVLAMLLPRVGIEWFSLSSTAYMVALCAGLFMMFFLNSPGRNPLLNFGAGLWNTYNDLTGLLSDVLSYIRLFALCLSGGVLALVFNDLAMGMSSDIPVVKQLVMLIILLIGHGLNLFMSTLSSFVHPMRLTFVEFYKNSGFEASQRTFNPLKKD